MRVVSIDFETHLIKSGMLAPSSVCMSWHDGRERGLVTRLEALNLIRRWLRDPDVLLGGHNIVFDLGVAVADDPTLIPLVHRALEAGRVWCTKVRQQLLDIARGELMSQDDDGDAGKKNYRRRPDGTALLSELSLQALMLWWFDEMIAKDGTWRLNYNELDGVPIDEWPLEARSYAGDDAIYAWRVYHAQQKYIDAGDDEYLPEAKLPNQAEQMQAAWSLHLMSEWGMRTDAEATRTLREVLEVEQAEAHEQLKGSGIYVPKKKREPDGDVKKDMKVIYAKLEAAFAERGIECPKTNGGADKLDEAGNVTKKGRPPVPQTDKDTLMLSGDPDLRVLALSMQGAKILNTYVPVLERGTRFPICAAYNVLVETGRTSCKHPNMQNPPRKGGVRECFVPSPGHVFCSVDFDTAELRSLAQICLVLVGYSKLGEALQAGKDPHLLLAAQMLKISPEECERRYAAGDKAVDEMRQFCKIANFGFPGGLGVETFITYAAGYGVQITAKEAAALRDAWFATWKEMRRYFEIISGMTGDLGASIMQVRVGGVPGTRKLLLHRRRGGAFFTQAANGLFQGLTADGAKAALWAVTRACYEAQPGDVLYGVRPCAFLHDEIMFEIPYDEAQPERASASAYEVARRMREGMEEWVKDIPIKCGPAMFRRWYKGAKAVKVGEVLVPSRPMSVLGPDGKAATKWVHDRGEQPLQAAA